MSKPTDPEKQNYMFTDDIKFLQKAVVFHPDKNGIFLALKRSPQAFSRPNDWDLPGGNVLFGELHEESLRKEIKEEAGLEVTTLVPVQIITTYDKEQAIYFFFNGFSSQAKSVTVTISEEHSEYRWVTEEEFMTLKPAQYLLDLVAATFEKLSGIRK